MTEKIVHVDAYTRSGGTYVHEHERHINTDSDYSVAGNGNNLLLGGFELNNYLHDLENDFKKSKDLEFELLKKL